MTAAEQRCITTEEELHEVNKEAAALRRELLLTEAMVSRKNFELSALQNEVDDLRRATEDSRMSQPPMNTAAPAVPALRLNGLRAASEVHGGIDGAMESSFAFQ